MSNSKQATNSGEGNKDTVFHFIREMIQEGKCAWFVDRNGRYRVKWEDIVTRHINYREKKKGGITLNITWKQASNNLRESLLRRYCSDGAKENEERQTLGKKRKIDEREFQMPHEVFRKLFVPSEIQLPDEENRRVDVDPPDEETPFEIAGLSSEDIDTILEENANDHGNQPEAAVQYNGSSSGPVETSEIPVSHLELSQGTCCGNSSKIGSSDELPGDQCETRRISASDLESTQEVQSLLQLVDPDYEIAGLSSANANNDGDQAREAVQYNGSSSGSIETSEIPVSHLELSQGTSHGSKIGSSYELLDDQIFVTFAKLLHLALNDVDQCGVVQAIYPSEGHIEGGCRFSIRLAEKLLESDRKGVAHFGELGVVVLKKESPWSLSGVVPAAKEAGTVLITVFTEAGRKLGTAYFTYEDVTEEEEYLKSRYGHWLTPFLNRWKQ